VKAGTGATSSARTSRRQPRAAARDGSSIRAGHRANRGRRSEQLQRRRLGLEVYTFMVNAALCVPKTNA